MNRALFTSDVMKTYFGSSDMLALDTGCIGRAFSTPFTSKHVGTIVHGYLVGNDPSIAVVDVRGPLLQCALAGDTVYLDGYDRIATRVVGALRDTGTRGVVLLVDSPGGDVLGAEDCVRTIVAARDAIGKPIVSYIEYTAHSAAYFLVAGVSNAGIYCLPEASVGSIGIVGRLTDNSKANDLHGYKVRLVREPPGKAAEDPDDPVPDIALARVTEHIATLASRFYTVVANARNISPQALRDLNGGYFSGEKALDLGLVDGIETFSDAVSRAFGTRTGLSNSTYAMIGEGAQMEDANTLVHRGLQFKTMQSVTQPTGIVAGVQPLSPTTLNAVLPQPPQAPGVLQHAPIVAPVNVKMESPPAGDPPADSKGSGNTGADLAAALTELAGAATAAADALVSGNIDAALPATSTVMAAMDRCRGIAQALFGGAFGSQQSEQAPAAVPVSMAQMYSIVSDIQKTVAQQQAVSKAQQEIIERTRLLSGKRIPKDKAAAINTMPIENLRIAVTMLDDASVVHPAAGLFPHIPQPGNPVTPSGLTPEQAADCARLNGNPQAYQRLIAGLQIT